MMILISVLKERRRETFLLTISQGQHELIRKIHNIHLVVWGKCPFSMACVMICLRVQRPLYGAMPMLEGTAQDRYNMLKWGPMPTFKLRQHLCWVQCPRYGCASHILLVRSLQST